MLKELSSQPLRYLAAVVVVIAAFQLTFLESTVNQSVGYALFLGGIILIAWHRGLKLGLLATVLFALAIVIFFLPSIHSPDFGWDDTARVGLFVPVAALISLLAASHKTVENLRRSIERVELTVQERTTELSRTKGLLEDQVDKRKRVLDALMESEERFRVLADTAPVMIWMCDARRLSIYFNKVWLDFTGRTIDQELGDGWTESVHSEDMYHYLNVYQSAFDCRQAFTMEYRLRRFDGEYRWILETGVPRFTPDGSFVGYSGSCVDITDRKTAEDALRKAEAKYRSMFENALEGMFQSTPDGKVITVNPALARMYGYSSPDEFMRQVNDVGRQFFVEPDARARFSRLLEEHGVIRGSVFQVYHKDGTTFWASINMYGVCDDAGKMLYYEGAARDVTKRKVAEEELRASERRFSKAFEANPQPMTITTYADGLYIAANDSFLRISGYTREEIVGHTSLEHGIWISQEARQEFVRQLGERGSARNVETQLCTKSGEIRVLLSSAELISLDGQLCLLISSSDITERTHAESMRSLLASIVESSDDAIISESLDGTILSWNAGAERIYGYSAREAVGQHVSMLGPDSRRKEMEQLLERLRRGERVQHFETVHATNDATSIDVSLTISPVYGASGNLTGASVISRDITERKRAEQALKASERQYRQLFNEDLAGDFIATLDGKLLLCNAAFAEMFGFASIKEALSDKDFSLFADSDERLSYLARLRTEQRVPIHEREMLRPDGRTLVAIENLVGRFDSEGNLMQLQGYLADISELKQTELALRKSDAENRALLSAIPDLMFRLDQSGTILHFPSSHEDDPIFPPTGFVGQHISNLLPSDLAELTMSHAELALRTRELQTYAFSLPVTDKMKAYEARIVTCGDDEVLVILRNVTDLRRTEVALRHLAERLTRAQEEERRRISRELHDEAGQALTAITMRLQLFEQQLLKMGSVPSEVRQGVFDLRAVVKSTQQRLRTLAHALHPSVLEHLGLTEALHSFLSETSSTTNTNISVSIPDDFPRFALPTETALYRIVQEAVGNSLKHSSSQSLSLSCLVGKGGVTLMVADDGSGFDPANLEAKHAIGLTSMRERAEMIGARLDIRSAKGQGTQISVYLPDRAPEQTHDTLVLLLQE